MKKHIKRRYTKPIILLVVLTRKRLEIVATPWHVGGDFEEKKHWYIYLDMLVEEKSGW